MKNNLIVPQNEIYTRQLAVLMFILTFTFKVSRLPSLIAEYTDSSGTLLITLYMTLEVLVFLIVYRFVITGGAEALKDNVVYKTLMFVLAANFFCKLVLTFAGTVLFTQELLFENVSSYEITLTLILPVAYAAYKGLNSVARTADMFIWLIALVLIINLVFMKAKPDFSNNLPLLNGSFKDLLSDGDKFFFWFGDYTPLLFVKLKRSKRNPVGFSLAVSFCAVIFCFILMYGLYGATARYISNFIVKMAGFNEFATKLGRLDWTGMIAWLIMSLIYMSVYLWAFTEAGRTVVKRKTLPFVTCVVGLLAIQLATPDTVKIVRYALTEIRWLAVVANYAVPLLLLLLSAHRKKTTAQGRKEVPVEQGA